MGPLLLQIKFDNVCHRKESGNKDMFREGENLQLQRNLANPHSVGQSKRRCFVSLKSTGTCEANVHAKTVFFCFFTLTLMNGGEASHL